MVIFALGFCHLSEHAEDDDVILPVVGPQQEFQRFQLVLLTSTASLPPYKTVPYSIYENTVTTHSQGCGFGEDWYSFEMQNPEDGSESRCLKLI
jgi:hypothetical protein